MPNVELQAPVAYLPPPPRAASLFDLLARHAAVRPAAPALLGTGRTALSYAALLAQAEEAGRVLASCGLGRGDRVALALPNGPEAAAAFLAVSCFASTAPLNPAAPEPDLASAMAGLSARAVIVPAGEGAAARAAARTSGAAVIELVPLHDVAGSFRLLAPGGQVGFAFPAAGDGVALLLPTSGTTARAKLVPLRHDGLLAAAGSIASSLALTDSDRLLNVMPLFHLHALSVLLASVVVGASVACSPPFEPDRFFAWLDEFAPTWYSAAPTLHQAVLDRAAAHAGVIARRPLRLIRSTSASLSSAALAELERTFAAPVIEAYAITEAPSQVTSNPLPPGERKPGSVGRVTGPRVAIFSPEGRPLPTGEVGEVALRGEHVLRAYENDDEANARSFRGGWFLTGDLGRFDADGYLYLTGRCKEIINRGGEKVAPREVEEALLAHPAVAQAVAFAVPHRRLGEDVGAAVVVRPGAAVSAAELRQFAAGRLADFKVPRQVLLLADLPKGPTGKVVRIGLAEQLGLDKPAEVPAGVGAAPETVLERELAGLWAEALGVARVGPQDDFFLSGGDSLQAAQLIEKIEKRFGQRLSPSVLFEGATVKDVARALTQAEAERQASLVPLQPGGDGPALYLVHCVGGELLSYTGLVRRWPNDLPLYGLRAPAEAGAVRPFDRIEDMAAHYLAAVRRLQPAGPYHLGGYSFGGVVALEMARQLECEGERVALLAVIDTDASSLTQWRWGPRRAWGMLRSLPRWLGKDLFGGGLAPLLSRARAAGRSLLRRQVGPLGRGPEHARLTALSDVTSSSLSTGQAEVLAVHRRARARYRPARIAAQVDLFRARGRLPFRVHERDLGWGALSPAVRVHDVPGNHGTLLREPHVACLAAMLAALRGKRQ